MDALLQVPGEGMVKQRSTEDRRRRSLRAAEELGKLRSNSDDLLSAVEQAAAEQPSSPAPADSWRTPQGDDESPDAATVLSLVCI